MANYHMEVKIISRGRGESVVDRAAYIVRGKLYDCYTGVTYNRKNGNPSPAYSGVFLPPEAPSKYADIQTLLNDLNRAERRQDAQMGRAYILSLPIELTPSQRYALIKGFAERNFTQIGQCVIYAIHENSAHVREISDDLSPVNEIRENPHAHLIVPLRPIGQSGFLPTKSVSRSTNSRKYLISLRKNWADCQNRMLSRHGHRARVLHESLRVQGISREPTIALGAAALALERKGIRTVRGDVYREIMARNARSRTIYRSYGPER